MTIIARSQAYLTRLPRLPRIMLFTAIAIAGSGHYEPVLTATRQHTAEAAHIYLITADDGIVTSTRVSDGSVSTLWDVPVNDVSVCSHGVVALAVGPDKFQSDLLLIDVEKQAAVLLRLAHAGYSPRLSPDCRWFGYVVPDERVERAAIARVLADNPYQFRGARTIDEVFDSFFGGVVPSATTVMVRNLQTGETRRVWGTPVTKSLRGPSVPETRPEWLVQYATDLRWADDSSRLQADSCQVLAWETSQCYWSNTWTADTGRSALHSPQGRQLSGGRWLMTSEAKLFIEDELLADCCVGDVEVSAAGDWVVFTRSVTDRRAQQEVWTLNSYDVRTSSMRVLDRTQHTIAGAHLLADRRVVYGKPSVTGPMELWLSAPDSPTPRRLASGSFPVAFTHDGKLMAFTRRDGGRTEVWATVLDADAAPVKVAGSVNRFWLTKYPGQVNRAVVPQWFVQVGAFRSRASADRVVSDLITKGHKAIVSAAGGFNRVRVGPFADKAQADAAAAALKRLGHSKPEVFKEAQ